MLKTRSVKLTESTPKAMPARISRVQWAPKYSLEKQINIAAMIEAATNRVLRQVSFTLPMKV